MECNPDDININNIKGWKKNNINRISLGVQSFFDSDLELMNRSHNSVTATQAIELIKDNFKNFSIDLIFIDVIFPLRTALRKCQSWSEQQEIIFNSIILALS